MNVLFLRPPAPHQDSALLSHTQPMNLAMLAAYLRERDHQVSLVDYEAEPYSPEALARLLADVGPELVGVSCMTPSVMNGAALCARVKETGPGIVTVVGGPHANALPAETLREFPAFDFAVFGEGEETLHELCLRLERSAGGDGVLGLAYRQGSEVVTNPPRPLLKLDSLPIPARDLLRNRVQAGHSTRGFANTLRSTELYTSRGCPIGCTFCAIQATFGKTVRFRSIESLSEEISQITDQYHINHLVIADDTFTLSSERAFALCDLLARSPIASWNCDTRVTSVTLDLLRQMQRSGCEKVAFGVESGSQRIMDCIGKKITVAQVRRAVHWAREAGIRHIEGNFIIGADPSETADDIAMTRALIAELPWTFVSIAIIVPYPGTPVYKRMLAAGQINDDIRWDDFVIFGTEPRWHTDHFSAAQLLRLQKQLTREFYLRPSYILRQMAGIRSWQDLSYWASAGSAYLRWYMRGRL